MAQSTLNSSNSEQLALNGLNVCFPVPVENSTGCHVTTTTARLTCSIGCHLLHFNNRATVISQGRIIRRNDIYLQASRSGKAAIVLAASVRVCVVLGVSLRPHKNFRTTAIESDEIL